MLGESVPLAATVDSTDTNYLETRNIGLQGTHCASGSCTGIVVSTGNKTVFGKIAKLTNEPKVGLSTLEKEILSFVWIICSIMLLMIIIVIVLWYACFPGSSEGSRLTMHLKGCLVTNDLPGLDKRAHTYCRLRVSGCRFHPGG